MKKTNKELATPEQLADMEETEQYIYDGKIYAKIESVAPSGMSRRISFYIVNENKRIENVTYVIAWLTNWEKVGTYTSRGKNLRPYGLFVSGCGMDLIFHTLYTALGYEIAKDWKQKWAVL